MSCDIKNKMESQHISTEKFKEQYSNTMLNKRK